MITGKSRPRHFDCAFGIGFVWAGFQAAGRRLSRSSEQPISAGSGLRCGGLTDRASLFAFSVPAALWIVSGECGVLRRHAVHAMSVFLPKQMLPDSDEQLFVEAAPNTDH